MSEFYVLTISFHPPNRRCVTERGHSEFPLYEITPRYCVGGRLSATAGWLGSGRGNQRQVIFRGDADRKYYLEPLEQYRERYGFKVYAYVLMSNHVHLLIETGRVPLSKIMQGLQLRYTGYFNRKYKKVGHLFQGRYKAILCDRDAYLLELVRYLHLNPERMRAPMDAGNYRWSSHRAYLGKDSLVKIETAAVLGGVRKFGGQSPAGVSEIYRGGERRRSPVGLL